MCTYLHESYVNLTASDLAGVTYGLEVLDVNIEDDENNFTRFLLLSRSSVSSLIPPLMAAKTSVVFVLPNNPGMLSPTIHT